MVRELALSYVRFSTKEQAKGDSQRRQKAKSKKYADDHNLEITETITFSDPGVSALRGRNYEKGALAELVRMAEAGEFERHRPPIRHLIVESLDRLSRLKPRKALTKFLALIDTGLTIHTITDNRVYSAQSLDKEPMELFASILIMIRANEESETKSNRLNERRGADRARARAGGYFAKGRCPAWLVWDGAFDWNGRKGWFRPISDRAAWITWIFQRAAEGMSLYAICRELIVRKVPTFNHKNPRGKWSTTYLSKLIRTEVVLGARQPCRMVEGKATPEGEVIRDYYPAVISADLWMKAQRARREKNAPLNRSSVLNVRRPSARCP